jgi:hypothetical protein
VPFSVSLDAAGDFDVMAGLPWLSLMMRQRRDGQLSTEEYKPPILHPALVYLPWSFKLFVAEDDPFFGQSRLAIRTMLSFGKEDAV